MSFTICGKRQRILDAPGHCLVTGGPGCGKTTLGLLKALARIKAGLSPGQEVLFLSFSRAAVSRIMDAASEQIPVQSANLLNVQTFHSFFWKVLRSHGYLLGSPRRLSVLLAHDERAMSSGIGRDDAKWKEWEKQRLNLFKTKGQVCFDLFAPLTLQLLSRAKRVTDRLSACYPLILVDEAQDTNAEQWKCVQLLSEKSQLICLADPNQMIYDFIPGVGPERLAEIRKAINPCEIDLQSENNRSPGTEIALFGRDILLGKVRGRSYAGVSRLLFNSNASLRDSAIRKSVGILRKQIIEFSGAEPQSMAIIATYGSGVAVVSAALQGGKAIPHQVLFDEVFALLSSRIVAFLLEPRRKERHFVDVASLLRLVGSAFRAKGKQGAIAQSVKCEKYAARCEIGDFPSVKIVFAANRLILNAQTRALSGDPRRDWLAVKQDLREADDASFREIAGSLEYLVAFGRGRRICDGLSAMWLAHGAYPYARTALESALAQEQLLSAGEQLNGIHVMNTHKCKGKQFDGVVLYRQQHHSPFVWRGEVEPFPKSRKLLQVAITRAKYRVLVLDERFSECPISDAHVIDDV